jgi:hypothetical protein
MKIELQHYDTCLSDYFGGHHNPVIQIPIYAPMWLKEIKEALLNELSMTYDHYEHSVETEDFDQWYKAAQTSIKRLTNASGFRGKHFKDIELPIDDMAEPCYAYFIFNEVD